MTPAARLAAVAELLQAIEETPRRPADATANDFFRARRFIGGGDRRVVADTLWAIIRQRLRLDWHLGQAGTRPSARLLLAAHLALAEGRSLAAIEAVFAGGRFALEPLDAREKRMVAALVDRPLRDPAMPEDAALNIPAWALPHFRERFGAELAAEAAAMERTAPLDLRANLLRTTREDAAAALARDGIATAPTPFSPWGLRAEGRKPVTGTEAFKAGLIEVQDEGSQLIALLTDAQPGLRVADYCAGAAGKTLAIAAVMQNKGRITACDTSAVRLEGAVKRLRRAGVDNAERHLLEPGDKWGKRRAGSFDRVLVDAPCTGSGTWRRNPDARLRTVATDLEELTRLQSEILGRAAELVRPGGRLVYATCSLFRAENEGQMDRFLERHPDFAPLPLAALWAALRPGVAAPGEGPWLSTSPARHGTDGFFAAVLERRPT
jgi:16S rRNA (cytosine967-C5)-methyltransferase